MKEGEECNMCVDTLTEACTQFGEAQPEFCELKEKYMTDPYMGSDDVVTELTRIMTPDQKQQVVDTLLLNNSSTPDVPVKVNPIIEPLGE